MVFKDRLNTIFTIFLMSSFAVMLTSGSMLSSFLSSSTNGSFFGNIFNRHIAFAQEGGDDGGGGDDGRRR